MDRYVMKMTTRYTRFIVFVGSLLFPACTNILRPEIGPLLTNRDLTFFLMIFPHEIFAANALRFF